MQPTNSSTPSPVPSSSGGPKASGPINMDIPPAPEPDHSKGTSALREFLSTVGVLVAALLVALGLIAFVFQSYQVDGPSMQQTLHNNDRLIVWKLPRTWARITGHQYVPKRGDILIFTESGLSAYGQTDTKQLIKRVIGLPGDRVVVKNNVITIYNKQFPNGFQPDKTLPYHNQITEPATQDVDVTLAKDQLFMCGDNRTNSLDSRFFGPINTNQVIGKLVLRVLPLSDAERF
ncbi:MAG TPA: signal peptidase I [Candidatus Saccharimonadales bacterium]|nr:signal peptidase I [Candidatus Saccharimonadales bacterium]